MHMWDFHVGLPSKCTPRYLTLFCCGNSRPSMVTTAYCSFLRLKLTCTDLVALTIIFHLVNHWKTTLRLFWRALDVYIGHVLHANMAVSSANVAIVTPVV